MQNTEDYRKAWKETIRGQIQRALQEITNWEDYDDDEPNKRIGFQLNFGADGGESPE